MFLHSLSKDQGGNTWIDLKKDDNLQVRILVILLKRKLKRETVELEAEGRACAC